MPLLQRTPSSIRHGASFPSGSKTRRYLRLPRQPDEPNVACVTHVVDVSDDPVIVFLFPWDYLNVHHDLNAYYRYSIHYF